MLKTLFCLPLLTLCVLAQDPVTGEATISFVEGGSLCDGALKRVDIYVDVTGLSGQGGDAGLNAFRLDVLFDDSSFYVRSTAGSDPIPFELTSTDRTRIDTVGALRLVGYNADPNAPNSDYLVASVFVGNQLGSVTLDLDLTVSSLGSRIVGNAGPGAIGFVFDGPLTLSIGSLFPLPLGDAYAAWLTDDPTFDLQSPLGSVDIRDLVAIAECAGP